MRRQFALLVASATVALGAGMHSSDLIKLRSVETVQLSPDGSRVAFTVTRNNGPLASISQIWILSLADGTQNPLEPGDAPSSDPVWSFDGKKLAYTGTLDGKQGLIVADADGGGKKFLAAMNKTNSPLPDMGATITWSPDAKRIAYVSAQPGPETADLAGDPVVITRSVYKPSDKVEGTKLRDGKRLHIFVVDLATGESRPLTSGDGNEHSIDWSPDGKEIVYISHAEPSEQFFNYDLFTVSVATGQVRRLTATEGSEYKPRWSPDGKTIVYEATKRGLTGLEFPIEDAHIWLIDADGSHRRELTGAIDNRQHNPGWSSDGGFIYFTVQERGSVTLNRISVNGGKATAIVAEPGEVVSWSAQRDQVAYALGTPDDKAQLYVKAGTAVGRKLTDLNREALTGKSLGRVEPFTFISTDNKWTIEAFLTYPVDFDPNRKYPLVTVIHGGPFLQQGPAFDFKNQVYASRGFATLMVNYRGSTSYGQSFVDAVYRNQDGTDGQDILYGINAALQRNLWIDRERLGIEGISYGGQLTAWLITQTNMFKAAVPTSAVINIISFNYTTNFHQYEQVQWGQLVHQGNLMEVLWERSPLKHVAKVRTPVLLAHGECDNDVPIYEAEQFFTALRDVGTDSILVRYPREAHGIREPKHIVDWIDRSIAWYDKYFR